MVDRISRRAAAAALATLSGGIWLYSQSRQPPSAPSREFRSYARYPSEEAAARRAVELGVGRATLEGPSTVSVDSLARFTLRFIVGRTGMKSGGGIRIATAHGMFADWGGYRLQDRDPTAENYVSYRSSTGSPLRWTAYQGIGNNPLFSRYHPWQHIHEFRLEGPDLKPGDFIEVRLGGDETSPGVRMQQNDETAFTFKFYVDWAGEDDYLPLAENPSVRIAPGEPATLHLIAASGVTAGDAAWLNVWVGDRFGNPVDSYTGTIRFDPDPAIVGLPAEYVFQRGDRGAHRFENVIFQRPGIHFVKAREKSGSLGATSNPIRVAPRDQPQKERIYWGDIHTHTMYSDGRGTPAETYEFAYRISALDFASVSDHSFLTTDAMWREIKDVTNRYNQPGRFVTFLAYEWSGQTEVGGDHNVYTSDPDMPILRCYSYYNYDNLRMYHGPDPGAAHVEQLFRRLSEQFRNENILVIPHFGGRPGNPAWHNPQLQRQIEIFSDHRRSEDWASQFLQRGYRLGIMASTDNHSGNAGYGVRRREVVRGDEGELYSRRSPAEAGTSLVAAYAPRLTRNDVFQALYHRRTYATTGTRILLNFEIDGFPMGSEIRAVRPPTIFVEATGTAPIRTVRVVKNGAIIHALQPKGASVRFRYQDLSGEYKNQFYYVDLVQVDGEKAISSPIWID